jgi:hypothetical protein
VERWEEGMVKRWEERRVEERRVEERRVEKRMELMGQKIPPFFCELLEINEYRLVLVCVCLHCIVYYVFIT